MVQTRKERQQKWLKGYASVNGESYYKRYYRKNSEKRKRKATEYTRNMKKAVHTILGGECVRCGFDDVRALQIDHVNGGGNKEVKKVTKHYYKYVLEKIVAGSVDYQLLCANCNWIKRVENGEVRK